MVTVDEHPPRDEDGPCSQMLASTAGRRGGRDRPGQGEETAPLCRCPDPMEKVLSRYSKWTSLIRGVARLLLLKTAWRNRTAMETALKPEHLKRAEEAVV